MDFELKLCRIRQRHLSLQNKRLGPIEEALSGRVEELAEAKVRRDRDLRVYTDVTRVKDSLVSHDTAKNNIKKLKGHF